MKRPKRKTAKSRTAKPKTTVQRRKLKNGLEVEIDVQPTDHGYLVLHRLRGAQTLVVTCTCEGKGSVTKTCTYPAGVVPSPLCDCTGAAPTITC
jgi:hypothetical protein